MEYKERIKKLNTLEKFINGKNQDDIILVLDKNFEDDKWNVLCSVMHWFRTVETHLRSDKLLKKNLVDYNWGEVYLFLSSVDIVIEGINDINKIAKNKENCRLFYGEKDIFKNSVKDDWEYFKNIRAIFGAHPTQLKDNKEYIVATYPTPYNSLKDRLEGNVKKWDYYTLLWKKEKNSILEQLEFGFSFEDIERYLDKCVNYLDVIYKDIIKMIKKYKENLGLKEIKKVEDPIQQLNILLKEDEERLNKRYKYIIDIMKTLIETKISDVDNEKEYDKYRKKLMSKTESIYNALQYPNKFKNLEELENIIYAKEQYFTSISSYYYTKLNEYYNNEDMEYELIEYFKNRIQPFNNNIKNIKELFCVVKAYNYFINI